MTIDFYLNVDSNGEEYCDICEDTLDSCVCVCDDCGDNIHECCCGEGE